MNKKKNINLSLFWHIFHTRDGRANDLRIKIELFSRDALVHLDGVLNGGLEVRGGVVALADKYALGLMFTAIGLHEIVGLVELLQDSSLLENLPTGRDFFRTIGGHLRGHEAEAEALGSGAVVVALGGDVDVVFPAGLRAGEDDLCGGLDDGVALAVFLLLALVHAAHDGSF